MASLDNAIDLIKLLDEQKLKYIVAIWQDKPKSVENNKDLIRVFSSFNKNELFKLQEILKTAIETK